MFGNDAADAKLSTTSAVTPRINWNSEEEEVILHMKPHDKNAEHDYDPERHGETLSTISQVTAPVQEKHVETLSTTSQVTAPLHEKLFEDTATTEHGSDDINKTQITTAQTRDSNCRLPFAHLFSRKCRNILAKRPVYNMDALLDFII